MKFDYLVFSCFWFSLLYLLIVIAITLRSISKDTRCLTQQFIKFLMKRESEKPKCFTCRRTVNMFYAETYQGLKVGLCCSCHGHFWNETTNNKLSDDEAINLLLGIYEKA